VALIASTLSGIGANFLAAARDVFVFVDDDRADEPGSLDAGCDLLDLLFRVRPRIARIQPQRADARNTICWGRSVGGWPTSPSPLGMVHP
jgi:hypothetical protein